MTVASRIRRPCTLHTWSAGGRDDASGDYNAAGFTDSPALVEIQQQQTQEDRNGRVEVRSEWVALFRPPGVPDGVDVLKAQDEVTVPPMGRFAFEGDPYLVRRPSTQVDTHWFARLRKVT